MSASAIPRDGGVSDVLKMTEHLEFGTVNNVLNDDTITPNDQSETGLFTFSEASSDIPDEGLNLSKTDNEKELDRSCEPTASSCDSGIEDVQNNAKTMSSNSDGGESTPLKVDFGDPTQVINLLETVDLSEEDTEYLLQEAYSMNKKLKEILRRQEGESADQPQKQKQKNNKSKKQDVSSTTGSRQGSSFGSRHPLPPISCDKETTSVYSMKLQRARTNIPSQSFVHQHTETAPRSKSSKGPGRGYRTDHDKTIAVPSSKSSQEPVNAVIHKQKSKSKETKQEERPDWNSRWTYT